MADNVNITQGSGTVVATDDVSGVHYQRVKLVDGTLEGTDAIPGDATNGLDVDVTRVQGTVTVSATNLDIRDLSSASDSVTVAQATAANLNATVTGTVTANLAAGTNNIGDVDVLTVPAPLSTTGTGTEATALRVTIATDSTGVLSIDDNDSSLTVDGTVTANLAAGTNNIGDVDVLSIAAGDNNIGNVDIVTVPAPLSTTGTGTEATALRVTIATDSTGVLSVDDNNSSLTVDGTVTANLAAGTNNIGDVDVLTVPAPLSTTGGGTEATALRVTVASDSTGVLSVDDNGSSLTVDGTVGVTAGTGVGRPDNNGQTWGWKAVQSSTATTTAIWTPGSGKKVVVTYYQILASGTQDGDVQLWFGASGDTTYNRGTDQVIFDGHFEPSATAAPGIALTGLWPGATADHVLKVTTSAAINPLTVVVWGYEI